MVSPDRLLLHDPAELVRMVREVDEQLRKSGIDEAATSAAAKTYVQLLK